MDYKYAMMIEGERLLKYHFQKNAVPQQGPERGVVFLFVDLSI